MWGSARRPFRTAATVGGPGSEPPPYLSPSPNSSRNAPSPVPTRALSQHQLGPVSRLSRELAGGQEEGQGVASGTGSLGHGPPTTLCDLGQVTALPCPPLSYSLEITITPPSRGILGD